MSRGFPELNRRGALNTVKSITNLTQKKSIILTLYCNPKDILKCTNGHLRTNRNWLIFHGHLRSDFRLKYEYNRAFIFTQLKHKWFLIKGMLFELEYAIILLMSFVNLFRSNLIRRKNNCCIYVTF